MTVEIETFRPEHAEAFARLNRHWLEEHALLERPDEDQLADPQAHFLDRGGQIFVALYEGRVIGTCAVVPHGADDCEVAKLAVSPAFRGHGIGRRLVERCIAYARELEASRVILVSSSRLQSALRLYESMGFMYRALPEAIEYQSADVCMELALDITNRGITDPPVPALRSGRAPDHHG